MKTRSILSIVLCFTILTACSAKDAEQTMTENAIKAEDENYTDSATEEEISEENKEHAEIYERFLKGEEKVCFAKEITR